MLLNGPKSDQLTLDNQSNPGIKDQIIYLLRRKICPRVLHTSTTIHQLNKRDVVYQILLLYYCWCSHYYH